MTELVGEIYGRYRLDEVIGGGALGATYRATDQREARTVAVKLLRADLCADDAFMGRLREIAPRLIALSSSQIASFVDWGEASGRAYLASPLLAARTLRQQLDAGPGWRDRPLHESLILLSQAADGIADLHRAGIVHGDLRPENLFIDGAGTANERLVVADYGLRPLAAGRYLLGDPAYIAPEQLAGQPADRRGDIYALGVIIYEALTGAQPFAATSFGDALALHEALQPVPPRTLRPTLPAAVEATILRCLARNPDARYLSAAALAADLRALADELRPASAESASEITTTAQRPVAAITIRAAESTDLTLTPGEPQSVALLVANEGDAAATVRLALEGSPAGWGALSAETLTLGAGGSEQVTLTITVARDAHNSAGEYPVTIRAKPDDGAATAATLAMLWTVSPFSEGSLTIQPATEAADGTATYVVAVANLGNAPLRRALTASAPAPLVGTFAPETVDLDPHGEATSTLTISAPRNRVGRVRRLPLIIEAASSSAETLRATSEYRMRPRLPLWLPVVALLLLVAVGAGVTAFIVAPATFTGLVAPPPTPPPTTSAQEVPTATPTTPPPTTAPPVGVTATGRATSTAAPLTFSTRNLNFGAVALGGNAVQNIQVRNSSSRALTFGPIQIVGTNASDFTRAGPCGLDRLDVGLTCPLTIIFSPTGGGTRTARLTVSLSDGTTQTIELSGVATARPVGTPSITAPTRPVPPLAGARADQAASPLADGRRLLIAGGRVGANTIKSVEIYDLTTNTWAGGRDLNEARAGHTATLLPDGKVVVIGGRNGAQTLGAAEEYDPATQSWSPFPALITGREGHTTTLLVDGRTRGYRLLVLGGRNGGGVLDSGEIYDSNTRTWTETPRLLAGGRAGQTATLLKAAGQDTPRLLLVGGATASGEPARATLYDPLGGGGFGEVAGEPAELIARTNYTATLIEATGQVVFVGGASGQESVATVTVYDPAAPPEGAWRTTTTTLLNGRAGHTTTLLPYGRLLIVGGRIGARETPNTEIIDPARLANP